MTTDEALERPVSLDGDPVKMSAHESEIPLGLADLHFEPGSTAPRHRAGADVIVLAGGHSPCTVDLVDLLGEHRSTTWE